MLYTLSIFSAIYTEVIDSRLLREGTQIRRRRQRVVCNECFITLEAAELVFPHFIKGNDVCEPLNKEKLPSSFLNVLENGPLNPMI